MTIPTPADIAAFFEHDFPASLFPLKTNLFMMRNHAEGLAAHIQRIVSTGSGAGEHAFMPQLKTHAAKPRNHLRRTAVLDPVATYFVYDFAFRNRESLNPSETGPRRKAYGYRFEAETPVAVHKAFQDFSAAVDESKETYSRSLSFDIASYFNTLYRDDIHSWLSGVAGVSDEDASAMLKFLNQTNAGRSIDCLPQGIYPTKMIGSAFLSFIETNGQLQCDQTHRFMDDVYLFSDSEQILVKDFLLLQTLLGQSSLNVNPTKTAVDGSLTSVATRLSAIQSELDSLITEEEPSAYFGSGAEMSLFDGDDVDEDEEGDATFENSEDEVRDEDGLKNLSPEKKAKLFDLLLDPRAEEADVERILRVLLRDAESLAVAIPVLLQRFPNIVKQLHSVVSRIDDKESLATSLLDVLEDDSVHLLEYQLFWAAAIAEDHLSKTRHFDAIVISLYELTHEYEVARAKVLEIPAQMFGLKEIRDRILKSGASNWAAWASAIGARNLPRVERDRLLDSFATGSAVNRLIAECVKKMEP